MPFFILISDVYPLCLPRFLGLFCLLFATSAFTKKTTQILSLFRSNHLYQCHSSIFVHVVFCFSAHFSFSPQNGQ